MAQRLQHSKRYALGAAAMFLIVSVLPGGPRWVQAAVAAATQVFVTNTTAHPVPVTGSVSTRPTTSTPVAIFESSNGSFVKLFTPPVGKTTFALTSLTNDNNDTAFEAMQLSLFSGTACNTFVRIVTQVHIPAENTIHLDFPQPIVIAPGGTNWSLCALMTSGSSLQTITAVGYYY